MRISRTGLSLDVTLFAPLTTRASGSGFSRDVFPGSVIPQSRFNPIAVHIIQAGFPLPNFAGAGVNYAAGSAVTNYADGYMIRVDHNFSSNHRIFGLHLSTANTQTNPQPWPGFPAQSISSAAGDLNIGQFSSNIAFCDTITLMPTPLNEFVYGFQYFRNLLKSASTDQGWAERPGIQNAAPYPFPDVSIAGYSGLYGGNRSVAFDVKHQFVDNVTWIKGQHIIKAGMEWRPLYNPSQKMGATAGVFAFDTQPTRNPGLTGAAAGGQRFASLLLGIPSSSNLTVNNQKFGVYWQYWAAFIQDKWKLSRKITIDYGVRWEYTRPRTERWNRQSNLNLQTQTLEFAGENGVPRTLFEGDFRCFAPRFGLAYAPTADGKTSIRSPFGMFYLPNNNTGAPNSGMGFTASRTFQTLDGGVTFPLTLSDAFPVVPISRALNAGDAVGTIGPKYPPGYDTQWTFSVQREVLGHTLVDVSYVGMKGTHLPVRNLNLNLNQVPAASLGPGNAQARWPYPNWGNVTYAFPPIGNSIYHSVQFKVERRLARGFSLLGSYSLQKSIDDGSGIQSFRIVGTVNFQDSYNLRAERSISTFYRTHNVVVTGLYDLPFGKNRPFANQGGIAAALLGGWQVNAILQIHSGIPLSMGTSQNLTGSLGGESRPNRLRSGKPPDSQQSINSWFDTTAFVSPQQYTFGNDSRTEPDLRGPGNAGLDMMLARVFRLVEKVSLQFRGEAFNALNRVNFSNPNTSIGSKNAGIITSDNGPRILQLGARLWF